MLSIFRCRRWLIVHWSAVVFRNQVTRVLGFPYSYMGDQAGFIRVYMTLGPIAAVLGIASLTLAVVGWPGS